MGLSINQSPNLPHLTSYFCRLHFAFWCWILSEQVVIDLVGSRTLLLQLPFTRWFLYNILKVGILCTNELGSMSFILPMSCKVWEWKGNKLHWFKIKKTFNKITLKILHKIGSMLPLVFMLFMSTFALLHPHNGIFPQ